MCVQVNWLQTEGILSKENYKSWKKRGYFNIIRRGGGKDSTALISYDSIPARFKSQIIERLGFDPCEEVENKDYFVENIKSDLQALDYFNNYQLNDGRFLEEQTAQEYYQNAILLNATISVINTIKGKRKNTGGMSEVWKNTVDKIQTLNDYNHSLPKNVRRFRDKLNAYVSQGYESLIHKGFLNDNRRKVNERIEHILMSIKTMPTRPFNSTACEFYNEFVNGRATIYNEETGEVYDPKNFTDEAGKPIEISEATVWNLFKGIQNKQTLNKNLKSAIDFKTRELPYNHRHRPTYSLSKISMDDRALPRKGRNGWVNAYYAFDVQSECFIGWSHGREKDLTLVWECFRHMYSLLTKNNLPWPAECEVENHLMKGISKNLYSMFAYVRYCNPQNSREKRAEHAIKLKKYGDEKKHQPNIGRWTAKHDAYNVNQDIVQDLSDEQLIADDLESLERHNNAPHSIYKDKSRWQVLCENLNPELTKANDRIIFKNIGIKTETSIRNNDFVRVQYADYALSDLSKLESLRDHKLQAYYIPDADGLISKVYLYQGDEFICDADKYDTYNEAQAERTPRDEEIRIEQAKRQAHARKIVKDNSATIAKVGIINNDPKAFETPETETIEPVELDANPTDEFDWNNISDDNYYINKAENDL